MPIEAVVFDVDGVLVRAGEFGTLLEDSYRISRDTQSEFFGGAFRSCVRGEADLKESVAPFLEKWGWRGSVDDFLATWFEADSKLHDHALSVAAALRRSGYPCYVASTQEQHRAAYLENVVGLRTRFDRLFFSCRVGTTKGDPRFYEVVSAEIGAQPGSILFFDDAPAIVDVARRAGWNAEEYRLGDDLVETLSRYGVTLSNPLMDAP